MWVAQVIMCMWVAHEHARAHAHTHTHTRAHMHTRVHTRRNVNAGFTNDIVTVCRKDSQVGRAR